jgi:YgiT-type zinc finger domain-containing protein
MKSAKAKADGFCEYCRGRLVRARVTVYRRRRKLHVLFERVPALVCRSCGHRVFEASAVEAMEQTLDGPTPGKRTVDLFIVRS